MLDDEADTRPTRTVAKPPPPRHSAGALGIGMIGLLIVVVLANAC